MALRVPQKRASNRARQQPDHASVAALDAAKAPQMAGAPRTPSLDLDWLADTIRDGRFAKHPGPELVRPQPDEREGPGIADGRADQRCNDVSADRPGQQRTQYEMAAHHRRQGNGRPAGEAGRNAVRGTVQPKHPVPHIARRAAPSDAGPEEVTHTIMDRLLLSASEHAFSYTGTSRRRSHPWFDRRRVSCVPGPPNSPPE